MAVGGLAPDTPMEEGGFAPETPMEEGGLSPDTPMEEEGLVPVSCRVVLRQVKGDIKDRFCAEKKQVDNL